MDYSNSFKPGDRVRLKYDFQDGKDYFPSHSEGFFIRYSISGAIVLMDKDMDKKAINRISRVPYRGIWTAWLLPAPAPNKDSVVSWASCDWMPSSIL